MQTDEIRVPIDLDSLPPGTGHPSKEALRQLERDIRKELRRRSWSVVLYLQSRPENTRHVWRALLLPLLIPEDRVYLLKSGIM